MEKEFEKFIERVKQMTLSPDEKKKIRENLALFAEKHPVREEADSRPQLQKRSSMPLLGNIFQANLRLRPMTVITIVVAIVIAVSGGTAAAAESALPDDLLYKVKVNVNEEIRTALAFRSEAKAKVAADLAERRLKEAEELAAEGRLTAETRAELESRFESHLKNFKARVGKIEAGGRADTAAEVSSNFEALLRAHGQILAIAQTDGDEKVRIEIKPLLLKIQTGIGEAEETRTRAELRVSSSARANVEAAAEGKLKAAENKVAEVRRFVEKKKVSVSASTTAVAEAKLKLAEETVVKGKTQLEAEAFAEAFTSFTKAMRLAQEAQIIVATAERLKIDVIVPADVKLRFGGEGKASVTSTATSKGKIELDLGL